MSRFWVPVGIAALAAGIVGIAVPAAVPLDTDNYLVVVGLGVVAVLAGSGHLSLSIGDRGDHAVTPTPEFGLGVAVPGDDLRDVPEREFRERLRERAVARLVAERALDRETARRRVDDGSWTRDAVVARYLGTDEAGPAVSGGLRSLLGLGSATERTRRRAVDAVAAIGRDDRDE